MKKFLSLSLAALTVATTLAACAPAKDKLDPAITLTSSAARANAEWLDKRLDVIPDDVIIGLGSNVKYGIDMTDFENDGYIARAIDGDVLLFGKTEDGLDRAVREYAKAVDAGNSAVLDTVYHEGKRIENLTIAGTDIAEFTVVYNDDAPVYIPTTDKFGGWAFGRTAGNAQYAATELIRLIEQATGITLKSSPTEVAGPMIKIDYLDDGSCGENGFTYEVKDGNLCIYGAPEANGCANGVYYFLQEECGWISLLEGDSDLQKAKYLDVPEGTAAQVDPAFDFYDAHWLGRFPYQNDRSEESQEYVGRIAIADSGMQRHDWALRGGPHLNQICHTDEIVYSTVLDNIIFYVESQIAAGNVVGQSLTTIDIAQVDAFGYCRCQNCYPIYLEEANSHAGPVVRFANRISEDMEEYYPGLVYTIFAYHGSNNPCITKPNDNVYVTFCTDGHCSNHPLRGGECTMESFDQMGWIEPEDGMINNDDFAEWLKGWGELTDNLYVWYYSLNNNLSQAVIFNHLADDMKFLIECNVKGVFFQSGSCGMGLLRSYLQIIAAIIWNPDITDDELDYVTDDVLRSEYGDKYYLVREFINRWEETQDPTGCWDCWNYDTIINAKTWDEAMYAERADKLFGLLEEAKLGCSTKDQEMSIERLQMEVLYRQCFASYFKAYDDNDTETLNYLTGRYELFMEYAKNNGYYMDSFMEQGFFDLGTSLEEAAWINWYGFREEIPAGETPREMPEEYVKYYEDLATSAA